MTVQQPPWYKRPFSGRAHANGGGSPEAPEEPQPVPPPPIGRQQEIATFRRLAGLDGDSPAHSMLLAIVGPTGCGKRALLTAFEHHAREHTPPRPTAVVDLAESSDLTELLEGLAKDLAPSSDIFKDFRSTLSKYRYRQEHGQSRVMQGAEAGRAVTEAAREKIPTLATGVASIAGTAGAAVASALDNPRDIEAVKRSFVGCMARLAAQERPIPVTLIVHHFDRRNSAVADWVRTRLVKEVADAGGLLAVSFESEEALEQLPTHLARTVIRLEPLGIQDTSQFIEERLKINPRTGLAREIIKSSEGYPARLARFEAYFERYPDARKLDELQEDALAWAAGGSVLRPYERLEDPDVRRLVLCASALRRFNEPLLRELARVASIPDDSAERAIATLLDSRTRPAWISPAADGWTIAQQIRRPLSEECRRLDPDLVRRVHEAAARYFHSQLVALEGTEGNGDIHVFVPKRGPTERFRDTAFVNGLGDWLYHLLALDAKTAFEHMVSEAVDALVDGRPEAVIRVLEPGPGVTLPHEYEAYRRALSEVAVTFRDERYAEAIRAIEHLEALEPVDEALRIAIDYLIGVAGVRVGSPPERAVRRFERAEARLSGTDEPRRMRIRATNLTWLAYHGSGVDAAVDPVACLDTVEAIAVSLDDVDMQAEGHRVRALLFQESKQYDEALREFEAALEALSATTAPTAVARILIDKAAVELERGDTSDARVTLKRAAQMGVKLDDRDLEADVGADMVRLELVAGNSDAAAAQAAAVADIRPYDAYLRNRLGNVYYEATQGDRADLIDHAVRAYTEAIELEPEPIFFRNRGYARRERAQMDEEQDNDLLREAAADLGEGVRGGLTDPELCLAAATLEHEFGNHDAASSHAHVALELIAQGGLAQAIGGAEAVANDVTLRALEQALDFVQGDVTVPLGRCAAAYAGDAQIQYLLGVAQRNRGDLYAASEALRRAVDLSTADGNPARAEYLATLADTLCATGMLDDAEARAAEALQLELGSGQAEAVRRHVAEVRRSSSTAMDSEDSSYFMSPIRLELGETLAALLDPDEDDGSSSFTDRHLPAVRERIQMRTGVSLPWVARQTVSSLGSMSARLFVHGVPRHQFELPGPHLAAATPRECRAVHVEASPALAPWDGTTPVSVVDESALPALAAFGIPTWDAGGAVAATIEPVIVANIRSLIGSQYAAAVAQAHEWNIGADDLPALIALLRDLATAGLPPGAAHDSIGLGGVKGAHRELRSFLEGREVPEPEPPSPESYALVLPAVTVEKPVAVEIRTGRSLDRTALTPAAERAAGRLCEALGLPLPELEVIADPELERDAFEIAVDGATRVAGTVTGMAALSGRYCRRTHGPASDRTQTITRLLEDVLLDDPSLLLPPHLAEEMVAKALEERDMEGNLAEWAAALRRAVAERVPVTAALDDGILAATTELRTTILPRGNALQARPNRPIPDGVALGVRDVLAFHGTGSVTGLAVSVTVRHQYPEELRIRLISPDGREAVLHDREYVFGRDLRFIWATPDAPELEVMLGESAEGAWTLHIQDLVRGDAGTLVAWGLEIGTSETTTNGASEVPGPISSTSPEVLEVMRAERLAHALRPYEVEVKLGAEVADALGILEEEGDSPDDEVLRPLGGLLRDFGLPLRRTVRWKRSDKHAAQQYELVVNRVPRLRGEVWRDHAFVTPALEEAAGLPTACHPRSGRKGSWVPVDEEEPDTRLDNEDTLSPTEFVVLQLEGCLRDAAGEFADVATTEQFLDSITAWAPLLVLRLRSRQPVEVMAAALARLTDLRVSSRDPRVFDALLDADASSVLASSTDAAATDPNRLACPEVLAEHIAGALGDTIAYLHLGPDRGAPVITLDADTEDALRASVREGDWPEPVYEFEGSAGLLRKIEEELRSASGELPAVVVTSDDLRRHVRRLVAGQFTRLAVLSHRQVGGSPAPASSEASRVSG